MLSKQALLRDDLLYKKEYYILCGTQRILSRQDSDILLAQVTNHNMQDLVHIACS